MGTRNRDSAPAGSEEKKGGLAEVKLKKVDRGSSGSQEGSSGGGGLFGPGILKKVERESQPQGEQKEEGGFINFVLRSVGSKDNGDREKERGSGGSGSGGESMFSNILRPAKERPASKDVETTEGGTGVGPGMLKKREGASQTGNLSGSDGTSSNSSSALFGPGMLKKRQTKEGEATGGDLQEQGSTSNAFGTHILKKRTDFNADAIDRSRDSEKDRFVMSCRTGDVCVCVCERE